MKTKELIRQLQELDPTGEEECCLGNRDIAHVQRLPAYYDGRLQVLIRDPSEKKYCNIVGVEFRSRGVKIDIAECDIRDCLHDDPDFKVQGDLSEHWKQEVEKYRTIGREFAEKRKAT